MSTEQDTINIDIKEEDNSSQTIRRFKHGEVIDLRNEEDGEEKIEEKKEDGMEVMEVKSEAQSSIQQVKFKAEAIFLSQEDLKRLAFQHLGNQDLFLGMDLEIEAPQMKMDGKGGSGKKISSRRGMKMDPDYDDVDRDVKKEITTLRKQILQSFKAQTKEKMVFTVGFMLTRPPSSQVSLSNTLLYFPMIFLNHGLHLYVECFYQSSQQNQSRLACKVNFLPCSEEMREDVIKLFIECVVDIQNQGLNWSICRPSDLNAGAWTRVNWDLKAQKTLIDKQTAPTKSGEPQPQKNDKALQNKDKEKKSGLENIENQVRKIIKEQEKYFKQRTLSVGWINSSVNKKIVKNFMAAIISERLPKLATCSCRSGNDISFNRVDLLPSDDDARDHVLEVLLGELVWGVMDDNNFELKEVKDLPLSEGRNTWKYMSV